MPLSALPLAKTRSRSSHCLRGRPCRCGLTSYGEPPVDNLAEYARELGLPCFPCNDDKTPMVKGGHHAASSHPAVIERMCARASLIGVPTGAASELDVLDIDPPAKSWWAENKWRIPATRAHRTTKGGLHLFFRHEPGVQNTV